MNKLDKIIVGSVLGVGATVFTGLFLNQERKKLLKNERFVDKFITDLKKIHKKYSDMNMEKLKEHVKSIDEKIKSSNNEGLKPFIFNDDFSEDDMQYFSNELLLTKLMGLVDSYILNKISIFNKRVSKFSLYSMESIIDILEKLLNDNKIILNDKEFIIQLSQTFKKPVMLNKDFSNTFNKDDIEIFYKYTIEMIRER